MGPRNGGDEGSRTPDLRSASAARSQLRYVPKMVPRTGLEPASLRRERPVSYQLDDLGVVGLFLVRGEKEYVERCRPWRAGGRRRTAMPASLQLRSRQRNIPVHCFRRFCRGKMVRATRFERATTCAQGTGSTRLSYTRKVGRIGFEPMTFGLKGRYSTD